MYEHHECTPSLTHKEQRSAAQLIKRISPEKGVFRLPSEEQLRIFSVNTHCKNYNCIQQS